MSDEIFKDAPAWNGNHLAYFRLKLPSLLPKDVRYALYLDVDMLVVSDIRELFSIDLEDNYAGVVLDVIAYRPPSMKAKDKSHKDIMFDENYFNSGFLLLNIESIRKIDFWGKNIYLINNYDTDMFDQCALNEIFRDKFVRLSFAYNSMIAIYYVHPIDYCNDENKYFDTNYTREEIKNAMLNPKIYHYNFPVKPWNSQLKMKDNENVKLNWIRHGFEVKWDRILFLSNLWWKNALQTPVYKDELESIHKNLDNNRPMPFVVMQDLLTRDLKHKMRKRDKLYLSINAILFIALILNIILR